MAIMHNPAHPGAILREWIEGLDVSSQGEFAKAVDINRVTLSKILNGRAGITADMDVRLSKALGTTPGYWLALQSQFDLAAAMAKAPTLRIKRLKTLKVRVPDKQVKQAAPKAGRNAA